MNPITNAKNLNKLNERELHLGLTGSKTSWHSLYEESAWIFVGGLAYDLTEGDVIAVFSQYGEIVNINMVRDKKTGKTKGYCFICYEDQRSTNLAVDNFNGIKLLNRILRVDHVKDYRLPKEFGDEDEVTKQLRAEGCGPQMQHAMEAEIQSLDQKKEKRKHKKMKIKEEEFSESDGEAANRRERTSSRHQAREVKVKQRASEMTDQSSNTDNETRQVPVKVKTEPLDRGYERNEGREKSLENDRHRKDTYHSSSLNSKPSERSTIDSGYDRHLKRKESSPHGAHRSLEGNERQRNLDRERQRHNDDVRERPAYDRRPRDEDKGQRESVAKDRRSDRLSDDENARSRRREIEGFRGIESGKTRDSKSRNIDHEDDYSYSRKKRDDRDFASAKEYRKRSSQDRSSDGSMSPRLEDERSRKRR